MEFRKSNQDAFTKKYGLKLGFMSAFIAASSYALKDQPVVNAVIDGGEIVYRDYVDVSVAVATPKGLVVPVLRSVENKNFAEIEIALAALGDKAKKGKISVEDMDGGTFTISNGGVFGSLMGTPIINPPQSAILGMHGVFDRPIAVKGQVMPMDQRKSKIIICSIKVCLIFIIIFILFAGCNPTDDVRSFDLRS